MSLSMARRPNTLREYHVLVVRSSEGFVWEIRYDRHARPVKVSAESFALQEAAEQAGDRALQDFKGEAGTTT